MALVLVLAALALTVLVLALVRTVRADGYGTRTPPASHAPWWEADGSTTPGARTARR